jgi:hypothetical protein
MQSGTFQNCGSVFLDPGGLGNYSGYQNITMRINPSQSGKKLKMSFNSFSLGYYDYLTIYDGDALPENLIGTYSGTTFPPEVNAINSTGGFTCVFYSSGYYPSTGWQATLSCVDSPNAPSNLTGSAASGTQVNLSWQDNSTNETAMIVERKTGLSASQFTVVTTLAANTTSYSDQGLLTNQRYTYRIKALNGTVYSAYSNSTSVELGSAPILMGNGVISTCNSEFFDSGYTSNYLDGENYTLTVNPSTSGSKMRVTFTSLSLESCCDRLSIYDGPSTSSTLLGTYNGSSFPPVITATNAQGSLTFQFYSDGSVTYSGWTASLTCIVPPPPVITFDNINKVFGTLPFNLNATAYSGANFIYSIVNDPSNTGEVSLSGVGNKTVTILKSGAIKIKAFHPAANGYSDSEKIATLTISKVNPIITFNDLSALIGNQFDLNATAYLGAGFSYNIVADPTNTADVSLSGVGNKTVSAAKAGVVKLRGSIIETDNYFAAEKTITLTILKVKPIIAFNDLTKTFGENSFDLNATAYSGASFTYNIANDVGNTGSVTLSGVGNKTVTITKAGIIKLNAALQESSSYSGADKTITLTIAKANQTITLPPIADKFNTAVSFTVPASSSSGLPVSLSVKSGPASLSGSTLTLSRELGTVIIEASQSGNQNYKPANMASISFSVTLDPILGVEPVAIDNDIQIWPIPTERFITVKTGSIKIIVITLSDALGKETMSLRPKSNEFQIDLDNYSAGMYFLKFSTKDGELINRILVVK